MFLVVHAVFLFLYLTILILDHTLMPLPAFSWPMIASLVVRENRRSSYDFSKCAVTLQMIINSYAKELAVLTKSFVTKLYLQ